METKAGSGSGFSFTNDGFLITNRHVVRPATTRDWKEKKVNLEEIKLELAAIKDALDEDEM